MDALGRIAPTTAQRIWTSALLQMRASVKGARAKKDAARKDAVSNMALEVRAEKQKLQVRETNPKLHSGRGTAEDAHALDVWEKKSAPN